MWLYKKYRVFAFNKYVLLALAIGVLATSGVFFVVSGGESGDNSQLASATSTHSNEIYEINGSQNTISIELTGTLRSKKEASISSQVRGKVANIYKDIGEKVEKGELIAELEHNNLDAKIKTLKKKHQSATYEQENVENKTQAEINSAKKALSEAETKLDSVKQNFRQKTETVYTTSLNTAQNLMNEAVNSLVYVSDIQKDPGIGNSLYDSHQLSSVKGKAARVLVGIEDGGDYIGKFIANSHSGVRGILEDMEEPTNNKEEFKEALASFKEGLLLTEDALKMMEVNIRTFGSQQDVDEFNQTLKNVKSNISKISTLQEEIKQVEVSAKTSIANAKTAVDKAKQRLESARQTSGSQKLVAGSKAEEIKQSIEELKEKRSDMFIRAPFKGKLSKKKVQEGEFVNAGQYIFKLVGTDSFKAYVNIPDRYNTRVSEDKVVHASIDGIAGEHKGVVSALSPITDVNTRKMQAEIVFSDLPEETSSGLFVRANIPISAKKAEHHIPNGFIHYDYNGPYVMTKNDEKVRVEILHQNKQKSLISAKELSAGQEIVK